MHEITRETRLLVAVLACTDASGLPDHCALDRAREAYNIKSWKYQEIGAELGFNKDETFGIIDGWDQNSGRQDQFDFHHHVTSEFDFGVGYAIGKHCAEVWKNSLGNV